MGPRNKLVLTDKIDFKPNLSKRNRKDTTYSSKGKNSTKRTTLVRVSASMKRHHDHKILIKKKTFNWGWLTVSEI